MKCPNCNETNHEPDAVFCHNCGAALKFGKPDGLEQKSPQHNQQQQPNHVTSNGGSSTLWKCTTSIAVAVLALLLYLYIIGETSDKQQESVEVSTESALPTYPKDLSGNYFVRKIYGSDNSDATVKVYSEGNGYAMNVYSSRITRKYTFSYDPTTGDIVSDELGEGKAIIRTVTKETKITFEGWELLK